MPLGFSLFPLARHRNKKVRSLLALLGVWLLLSCAGMNNEDKRLEEVMTALPEPQTIRVSGFAALENPDKADFQARLLAMRASRLDAFRNLAEQVYGTVVYGESEVDEMTLSSDRFRTLVDAAVRGATVVDVKELSQGGYETVVELVLDGRFHQCLSLVNHFRYEEECRLAGPSGLGLSAQSQSSSPSGATDSWHVAKDSPRGE